MNKELNTRPLFFEQSGEIPAEQIILAARMKVLCQTEEWNSLKKLLQDEITALNKISDDSEVQKSFRINAIERRKGIEAALSYPIFYAQSVDSYLEENGFETLQYYIDKVKGE